MDTEDYVIVAKPALRFVTPNRKISFFLKKFNPKATEVEHLIVQWHCVNHSDEDKEKQHIIYGPKTSEWLGTEWIYQGTHTVVCTVKKSLGDKNPKTFLYVQNVISHEECLSYDTGSFDETENPFSVFHNLKKQIALIRSLESKSQLNQEENSKYQERMTNMDTYRDKLEYLLKKIPDSHKDNFNIVSARHYSYQYPDSNSILLQVCYFYQDDSAYLLDWTSPVQQGWCGVFIGKGDNEQAAVLNALKQWQRNNRYPEGTLKCRYLRSNHPTLEIPKYDAEGLLQWSIYDHYYSEEYQFTTDGTTWLDSISNALSWVAMCGAIVAGAILLFVPGGQLGTAALWGLAASSIAGITASTINIAQRYDTGFNNWKEDGLDSLSIVANLLGLGSTAAFTKWGPLSFLSQQAGNVAKANTVKAMLIGQVAADSTQAIMVSTDVASAIYSTLDDKTLPADEKLSRVLRLFAAGVTTGALTYINVKGTRANFHFIKEDASLLRQMTREEIDNFLNDPKTFLIENGNVIAKEPIAITTHRTQNESATYPKSSVAVQQLQEFKLLPAPNDYTQSSTTIAQNILFPHPNYLRFLTQQYQPEIFLKYELNLHVNFNNGFEATEQSLLHSSSQIIARNSNEQVHKTIANTMVKEERHLNNIAAFQAMARARNLLNKEWRSKVAISRATCEIKGITFHNTTEFSNLPFDLNAAKEKGVVVEAGEFTNGSAPIKVTDIDRYIATLNEYYPSEMDELTEGWIRSYIVKHNDHLQNLNGMPGAHAEVVAVDDVLKQLRAQRLDPEEYLKDIDVYTLKTNRPSKEDFLSEFVACANCSGILDPRINIHTGRKGE